MIWLDPLAVLWAGLGWYVWMMLGILVLGIIADALFPPDR